MVFNEIISTLLCRAAMYESLQRIQHNMIKREHSAMKNKKDQTLHNPLTVLRYLCVCGSSFGLGVELSCEHWLGIMHNALKEQKRKQC